ncbi:PTB_TBC1D1_like and TBC domain-containing protein plx isoform X1 [Megalopta genalis]|uniref:PTB_TBC1D1_like and TBC domain-containing protein plx isoform X1 n=2 Tax=Megalopta genalis TaxID=115081 RepID=UPI001443776F|nr:TBC1 domain family member 1 isoform X1 [Megalopta genalis]XP_033323300.1 TBC1 domain family member 1 isoform X1 [Megalopta genalis]XP_033323301.1 TBC1 domain family member 1 isoform X1 [Megalopta genalis]
MITVPISASSPYMKVTSYSDASAIGKKPAVQQFLRDMKEHSASSRFEGREVPQRSQSSAASLMSLGADISPSSSHFFEVLYVGKIKVSHPKVSEAFIDDALVRFRVHGLEKSRPSTTNLLTEYQRQSLLTSSNNRRNSTESSASETGSIENVCGSGIISQINPLGVPSTLTGSVEVFPKPQNAILAEKDEREGNRDAVNNNSMQVPEVMRNRASSTGSVLNSRRDSMKASDEHNRTMLFQVGRHDLRLISPDRKQVLLHKLLRDVASCVQGIKNPEHFGFICKENNIECFIGYVFKCQSESVADDLVAAISQAFVGTCEVPRKERYSVFSCEHCPMYWYSKLCQEVEGQNDRRTQSIIFSRMELLPEDEQEIVVSKYKSAESAGGTGTTLREQNQFLMRLLHAHCETKQARHVHDTAENRSEFLNQYLSVGVGSAIFKKAKRSLTNSFDNLMKRKGSRDDLGLGPHLKDSSHLNTVIKSGSQSPDISRQPSIVDISPDSSRPRSLRVSPEQQLTVNTGPKSSMMDIFLKVGNSPKMSPTEADGNNSVQSNSSWRQAILNRVVTPNKDHEKENDKPGNINIMKSPQTPAKRRTKQELRDLWKKAINQQLILIRMEKENARLRVRQEEATVKRIKLEYDELSSCARELVEVWDLLVSKESRVSTKCDNQMLLHAIKQGVPKGKRGEVWQFLAEQFCLKQPPIDTRDFPNYNTPYDLLLKQLTSQQHAILIDLGRTFPNHPYFSSALGPGQLALFNLLKAYSLLDHEVGYCQGLSFVAGVLLLHMSEDQAFFLLRHLMFRRGLRKLYLPDMAALQLYLYQLSRLLHDRLPAIYNHFDKHEVSPTLYAAPWLLTLFASQFPLGFVTRVFDLLFLESTEVLFRVSMALLEEHQDQLLRCDSFEEIMEYLKTQVPAVDKEILDRVMKRVFYPDQEITKQLNEYRVEYQVLQEEMISVKPQIENMEKMKHLNKQLTQEVTHLNEQLEITMSNLHRLETTRSVQQSTLLKLESQNRSLEVTVATLGAFIQQLSETRPDIEYPGEIRRIIAQLSLAEKRRAATGRSYPLKVIEDNSKYGMIKSNSTGRESHNFLKNNNMIDAPYPLKSTLSQPNLATKLERVSSFFSNSHNHIQKQRAQLAALRNEYSIEQPIRNDENDPKTVNIDIQITDTVNSSNEQIPQIDNNHLKIQEVNLEKSVSLPLNNRMKLKSSKSAYELGSVKKVLTTKLEVTTDDDLTNLTGTMHPLDTCSDVNFKYGGTTKLKSIKPTRLPSPIGQEESVNKNAQSQNVETLNR